VTRRFLADPNCGACCGRGYRVKLEISEEQLDNGSTRRKARHAATDPATGT
jgi:hypothetical protein